ncbi:GNAT family N-acetyltransferase [Yoonia sp. BS5-3]|uniref:GNAT family N-acetyltransferase n=1 Tax=Yoonia phaeophyticola TaxID=3137369 RepID=A0ABZ2V2S2_9RHOB
MIPTLHTERLTLRPYARADFDTYAAFMAGARSVTMGGPKTRDEAWTWFTNDTASWPLYGFGTLAVELDGAMIGGVGLVHPPDFPEPECGWFIFDGFENRGIATEAARAILDHTFATTDLDSAVSYIWDQNPASIKVAQKLGAVHDPDARTPPYPSTLVYRHTRGAA